MRFYSHPNKLLISHLNEVDKYSKLILKDKYKEENKIMSYCHDFGKYTTYFQKYLLEKEKVKTNLNNHGFISALFAAYIAFEILGEEDNLPLIIYNSVLHHHGILRNASIDLPKSLRGIGISDSLVLIDKVEAFKKQIEDMRKNKKYICEDYNKVGYSDYAAKFIESAPIEKLFKKLKRMDYKFERNSKDSKEYYTNQLLYSVLIASDKLSASNTNLPKIKFTSYMEMDNSRKEKFKESKGKLNQIRGEIFENIQKSLEENYKDRKIFSITAPTGTGKTYSGFFAALKLRELLGGNRKIIYSLPFTSIINQNYDSIYSLFKNVKDFDKNSSEYIIKHHSMANVEFSSENENYNIVQAELLLENWNSAIIITTFVQLLQTLISNKNRMLKKFNSIRNSIILLDEVQAIDVKYYALVDYILKTASKYLDCRIIMMTATKPLILQEAQELLKNNKYYFNMFKRTKLIPNMAPIKVEDFTEKFIDNIEDKSYLIICNTISQSLKIYEDLKKTGREIYYLSTNLIPKHRKERINIIQEKLKNNEKPILVSTQVVEAGVDFDFDEVIRDIAPIDSIIQAAGRCNRNNKENKIGKVKVYSMIDDNGNYYANYVYGYTSITISKELLQDCDEVEEKDYLNLIQKYFEEVNKNINSDDSVKFINSLKKVLFTKADEAKNENYTLDKFSLIDKKFEYTDVFMIYDDEAQEIFNKLMDALGEKDDIKRNEKFLKIKSKIRNYILSVPTKFKDKFYTDENTLVSSLSKEGCDMYYNYDTGFERSEGEEYMIF